MNTLTFNTHSIGASAPSAGLWRRAADLYWTGWTQYAASMNSDVGLRAKFPLPGFRDSAPVFTGVTRRNDEEGASRSDDEAPRLIDRAA